jgi:hypothetical protein
MLRNGSHLRDRIRVAPMLSRGSAGRQKISFWPGRVPLRAPPPVPAFAAADSLLDDCGLG